MFNSKAERKIAAVMCWKFVLLPVLVAATVMLVDRIPDNKS